MQATTASSLARDLMNQHGLHTWTFEFDRAKRRAGRCTYRHKIISLSEYYIQSNDMNDIRNTILHEIAHALAGPHKGHGPEWKTICVRIGAKPERCYGEHIVMPKGRFQATCGGCQKYYQLHRRAKRMDGHYCGKCGKIRGKLIWKDTLNEVINAQSR